MSMEDILKVLVNSRQQGSSSAAADPMADLIGGLLGGGQSQAQNADPMANLIGSLLGGAQPQQQSQNADPMAGLIGDLLGGGQPQMQQNDAQQSGGLSNMMGLLETVMGGGQSGSTANDPIMGLLKPFVAPLAKKANISPEIAMIVVSFVAHKLLAHHPTSGRDSNTFNLDDMFQQIGSGKIDSNVLKSSGMANELSKKTGLDEAAATKSLDLAFSMVGKGATSLMNKNESKPTVNKTIKSARAKGSAKINRADK